MLKILHLYFISQLKQVTTHQKLAINHLIWEKEHSLNIRHILLQITDIIRGIIQNSMSMSMVMLIEKPDGQMAVTDLCLIKFYEGKF